MGRSHCAGPNIFPLVDYAALAELEQQFDDPHTARDFVRDYVAALGERFLRLTVALGDRDLPAALEATSSLRTSSAMAGATRLAAEAAHLETAIMRNDLRAARGALADLERSGLETVGELQDRYLCPAPQGPV